MTTVLIVDDDHSFLRSAAEGLEDYRGIDVLTASDGKEAIKVLSRSIVEVVITDLKMPGMGGFELVAFMARTYPTIPVVLMTAFGTPEVDQNARILGISRYLKKPIDLDILAETISDLLVENSVSNGTTLLSTSGEELKRILLQAAREQHDGEIVVRQDDKVGRIFLSMSRVAWVAVSTMKQTLMSCILEETLLSVEELQGVFNECKSTGKNFGETLVEWKLIGREHLRSILRRYASRSLRELLSWREAALMFVPEKRAYSGTLTFLPEDLLREAETMSSDTKGTTQPGPSAQSCASPSTPEEPLCSPTIIPTLRGDSDTGTSRLTTLTKEKNMALENHLTELRGIKGFRAAAIMNFTGEVLVADSVDASIDLHLVGATFNDIFRAAHEASQKIGLDACTENVIQTPKGLVLMRCSGVHSEVHFHEIVIMDADGNQALMKMQMEKTVPKVMAELA